MLHDGKPFDRATALDLTGRRPYRLVRDGRVRELLRGVYLDAAAPVTLQTRAAAALLAIPEGAVLCRGTVAWLIGIGDVRPPAQQYGPSLVECVVPRGRTPARRPGVRCYQAAIEAADIVEDDGLLRTTDLRTAIDLGRWSARPMALAALDAFAAKGFIDPAEALDALGRFAGHRGAAQARDLLRIVEPLTESFGESWLRLRVVDAGFPAPTAQVPIVDADGVLVYRLDLGFRKERAGAEYDGDEHHGSSAQQHADAVRRDRLLAEFGWNVVGFHRGHVWGTSMHLERAIGELLGREPQLARRRW